MGRSVSCLLPRQIVEVRQMNDEEILRRFELGFFTEGGVCFQSPGDARSEVFDEAELIENVYKRV